MLKTISIALMAGTLSAGAAFAGMLNMQTPNMRFESASPALTALDENFVRHGKPVTVSLVNQIALGATQDQVTALLGEPVRVLNKGRSAVWDYNLKFTTAEDGDIVCQYKVLFDNTEKVDETVWRRPQCREIMLGHN